jgi:DNA-binding NarL/FixJ family response regulator
MLRKHAAVRLIGLEQYMRLSPLQRTKTVFVIDECGLEVPLYECLRGLRLRCANAKFLLIGRGKSNNEIVQFLIMGVQGYIPYDDVPRSLLRAICGLAANQLWVPHKALQEFLYEAGSVLHKQISARQIATPRESQILELVRRRLSNREIGERLHIRISTVKFHLSNILSKMNVNSRRELIQVPSGLVWRILSA